MKFQPLPRPRGDAARVVITEYDVTASSNTSDYVAQDGSDWMEGVRPRTRAAVRMTPKSIHEDSSGCRLAGQPRADDLQTRPKTGAIKDFKLDQRPPTGYAMGSQAS